VNYWELDGDELKHDFGFFFALSQLQRSILIIRCKRSEPSSTCYVLRILWKGKYLQESEIPEGARLTTIVRLHFYITVATVFLIVILGQLVTTFFLCGAPLAFSFLFHFFLKMQVLHFVKKR
jgi:hypothetical protein